MSGRAPGSGERVTITLCVSPDYLALGSDSDFMFVPMRLKTAIAIANHFDTLLPTRRIVDAIYAQARVHLQPAATARGRHDA